MVNFLTAKHLRIQPLIRAVALALLATLVLWGRDRASHTASMDGARINKKAMSLLVVEQAALEGPRLCQVELTGVCDSPRGDAVQSFTHVYRSAMWGTSLSSHTRSGSGSTMKGAFETITQLEPLFRELNITSVADVPSGDCAWQFAMTTINSAQAYFGGDITPHVAEENAHRYHNHLNKIFAFWDLVACPLPRWHTTCDATPRPFDIVIVRDVIQHMAIKNAMQAIKSVVLQSGANYIAVTSYSDTACTHQCKTAIQADGGWYMNNLHCPPWNMPEPFFKFASHVHFPEEADYMELYRIEDLRDVIATWPEEPCDVASI